MPHPVTFLVTLVCSWSLSAPAAWSQSADTGILGIVTDASGAIIPGATAA